MITTLVIDASAAIKAVLGKSSLADIIKKANRIVAPELYISEIINVFWKYTTFSEMPQTESNRLQKICLDIPDHYISSLESADKILKTAITHKKSAYDIHYIELAKTMNATLLTEDKVLKNLARKLLIPTE